MHAHQQFNPDNNTSSVSVSLSTKLAVYHTNFCNGRIMLGDSLQHLKEVQNQRVEKILPKYRANSRHSRDNMVASTKQLKIEGNSVGSLKHYLHNYSLKKYIYPRDLPSVTMWKNKNKKQKKKRAMYFAS